MTHMWFRYLAHTAPWLTLLLLVVRFLFLCGSLTPAPALEFELPDSGVADSSQAGLVALLMPGDADGAQGKGALVYFDDARYVLSDPASVEELSIRLGERAVETKCGTLTLLADVGVSVGDVMRMMTIAKSQRLGRVQLAEKRD